jgi:hypothetical protein
VRRFLPIARAKRPVLAAAFVAALPWAEASCGPVPIVAAVVAMGLSSGGGGGGGGGADSPLIVAQVIRLDGPQPLTIALADMNRDGHLDLVFNDDSPAAGVLLGRGDGTFAEPAQRVSLTTGGSMAVADFDRDGDLDAAVVGGEVNLVRGDGAGCLTFSLADRTVLPFGLQAQLRAEDLDRDGFVDLVFAVNGSPDVAALRGVPGGDFAAPVRFPVGQAFIARSLVVADFGRDGVPDILKSPASSRSARSRSR